MPLKLQDMPPGKNKKATCRVCKCVVREGESVLHERNDMMPYGHRDMYWHEICVRAVLNQEPVNATIRRHRNGLQMEKLRASVAKDSALLA